MASEIVDKITAVTVIASGRGIRQLTELRKTYGEDYWFEAQGIGRRRFKIKRFLDQPADLARLSALY